VTVHAVIRLSGSLHALGALEGPRRADAAICTKNLEYIARMS
jgi:hypothetical protein